MPLGYEQRAEVEQGRVRMLAVAMLLAVAGLLAVLWNVQVHGASEYRESLDRQSIRRVRLSASRGRILDRNGECLARNRPSYRIVAYVEEMRKPGARINTINEVRRVLERTSRIVGLTNTLTVADIAAHIERRVALPLVVWRGVGDEAIARLAECGQGLPGVDIDVEPVRVYPGGPLAAHIVGYVGRADPRPADEAGLRIHYSLPDIQGRTGIERALDETLAGVPGGSLIRVGASGFKYREEERIDPSPGYDVKLTLDLRIQRLAVEALEGWRGAVVVIDPNNGDVLAIASAPSFDPNLFSPAIPADVWERMSTDPDFPLLFRATSSAYPPGSTFKPVVALAALASVPGAGELVFNCPGHFEFGGVRFDCWQNVGHGALGFTRAIEQSCNVYFFQLGLQCGPDWIHGMGLRLGLGRPTGLITGGESGGILPDEEWKRRRLHEGWRGGDTCNFAIGQGFVTATPLQMARMTAAVANGGHLVRPRIVLAPPEPADEPSSAPVISSGDLALVQEGMRRVVESNEGSGRRARIEGVQMAGKTGTAEFGPKSERKKYTWMTLFAPFEKARYAVAMVVEEGDSGGRTVAPRVHDMMAGIFGAESRAWPAEARR
jgi:penicillin-binding protein 2